MLALVPFGGAETWTQIDGKTFEGDFQRTYGPWVHFSRGGASFLRLARQLAKPDQARIENLATAADAGIEQDWGESESLMAQSLEGRLFFLDDGKKRRFRFDGKQEPEFYVLYYSAGWCGPCRQFTPALVNTYQQLRDEGIDNFEVFFISGDRRRPDQFIYMRDEAMRWPAVDLNRMRGMEVVNKYKGRAIPCLVVVDRAGNILAHTFQGEKHVGPGRVLNFLHDLLFWTNPENAGLATYRFGRVCERVLAEPPESVEPLPFFVTLGTMNGEIETLGPLLLKLSLTKGGQVEAVGFPEEMDTSHQAELESIVRTWLFLPRVGGGEPVSCEMEGTVREFLDWSRTTQRQF